MNNQESTCMSQKSLTDRLNAHPELKARMEALLNIAEDIDESIILADDIEQLVVDGMRGLGHELMQDWAKSRSTKAALTAMEDRNLKKKK